jgi:hypothetical protein
MNGKGMEVEDSREGSNEVSSYLFGLPCSNIELVTIIPIVGRFKGEDLRIRLTEAGFGQFIYCQ